MPDLLLSLAISLDYVSDSLFLLCSNSVPHTQNIAHSTLFFFNLISHFDLRKFLKGLLSSWKSPTQLSVKAKDKIYVVGTQRE